MAYLPNILAQGTGGTFTSTAAVPTVAQIAAGVWDESSSGHTTAGSYGLYVSKILKFIYVLLRK